MLFVLIWPNERKHSARVVKYMIFERLEGLKRSTLGPSYRRSNTRCTVYVLPSHFLALRVLAKDDPLSLLFGSWTVVETAQKQIIKRLDPNKTYICRYPYDMLVKHFHKNPSYVLSVDILKKIIEKWKTNKTNICLRNKTYWNTVNIWCAVSLTIVLKICLPSPTNQNQRYNTE